ncbi:AAA family ATPase [Noviherbaspirillum sp. ST9]|uniref:AAA family ATPase n=1 Tax=Noviherbaspirillum sp. ST9 TaxID=3401606 RepID=UPI003B586BBB
MDKNAQSATEPSVLRNKTNPDEHPVIRNRARLPTPPIRNAFNIVSRTVLQRDPGCCFIAHPRFGKTSAIRVLSKQLAHSFPAMPIVTINAKSHQRFSEATFYGELLTTCGHGAPTAGKIEARRSRFFNFVWALAQSRDSDRVLIFIDEAQNWHESEFSVLRDLSNDLSLERDVILIAVFFGQPELASIRTALLQSARIDLIGRFMIQQHNFAGLATLAELVETMGYYDDPDVSEYPEGSGTSYSEFLLGAAFRSGWRLQNESGRLWKQFKDAAQPHGGLGQLGMHWVAASIRTFFVSQMEYDHPGLEGTDEDWENAVRASGFAQSLGVTYVFDDKLPVVALH